MNTQIPSKISIDFLKNENENLYFDRKRASLSLHQLANSISSFANSNGGLLVLGITDDGKIEGFNDVGKTKLNDVQKVITTYLSPSPTYKIELLDVTNMHGEPDKLVLFHLEPSMNYIVRNNKGEVYCRQGDSSIKLSHDQIKSLEYDRKERNFETEIINESTLDDIDTEIVSLYRQKLQTNLNDVDVLTARGFLRKKNDSYKLTNAGMLLFGKNPSFYLPSARLRVVKFEGDEFKTGTEMNIVKDITFDKNIYRILLESRTFINTQLRDFNYLTINGTFEKHQEYPEFAWYEGIVNALTHRDYSNSGEHIIIKLYNNRMEILSPGKLGGFVTINTIKIKRYSRNPIIARTLNELGIVRELNEGVKRIFSEMEKFKLEEPIYSEPDRNSVLLILNNNIYVRSNSNIAINNTKIRQIWEDLSYLEQKILEHILNTTEASRLDIEKVINRSKSATTTLLNKLISKKLLVWTGSSKNDAKGKYMIK